MSYLLLLSRSLIIWPVLIDQGRALASVSYSASCSASDFTRIPILSFRPVMTRSSPQYGHCSTLQLSSPSPRRSQSRSWVRDSPPVARLKPSTIYPVLFLLSDTDHLTFLTRLPIHLLFVGVRPLCLRHHQPHTRHDGRHLSLYVGRHEASGLISPSSCSFFFSPAISLTGTPPSGQAGHAWPPREPLGRWACLVRRTELLQVNGSRIYTSNALARHSIIIVRAIKGSVVSARDGQGSSEGL